MMLVFSVQSSFPKIARNGGDKTPAVLVFRKGRRKRERKRHHFSLSLTLSLSKSALNAHTMHERFNTNEVSRDIWQPDDDINLAAKTREFCLL